MKSTKSPVRCEVVCFENHLYLLELYLQAITCVGDFLDLCDERTIDSVETVPHLLGGRLEKTMGLRPKSLGDVTFGVRSRDVVLRELHPRVRGRHADNVTS